ncbi:hypothetical protein JAO29_16585 [Edaphobacter sp. HDX4]|uniref:hypothetical protein n=1 Tax=Edaphobacter sp. HDX4 TaxID=2794064 RepID=UPI002FE64A13
MVRGKILRDTTLGAGLIAVDGEQYAFTLEGIWKSQDPPTPGMSVDVELSSNGEVIAVSSVPESQIAREQAELVLAAARKKGGKFASGAVERFGMPSLIAAGVLFLGWFVLSAASIQTPLGSLNFTFWQLLGLLNSNSPLEAAMQGSRGGGGSGIYGLMAIAAFIGPFVSFAWKDKRAPLAGLLPLVFMALIGLLIRNSLNRMAGAGAVGGAFDELMDQGSQELMKAISIGTGVYLSSIASGYFAWSAIRETLVKNA